MRAASFEATEDLDALADAEIADEKDVGKAGGPRVRAAALVVGRKKGNVVEADGRDEGGDENPTTEEVQEGGRRQRWEDGGEETAMEKRPWLWIFERRRTEARKGGGGKKKRPDERSEDDGLWKKEGNGGEKKKRAAALAVAATKRRTNTWAERGRWIRQEEKPWAASWGRRWLKTGKQRRCWRWRVKKEGRGWEDTGGNTGRFPRF